MREWRLAHEGSDAPEIYVFANWRGSCSLRRYDARTGRSLAQPERRTGQDFQQAFRKELRPSRNLFIDPAVSLERDCATALPRHVLEALSPYIRATQPTPHLLPASQVTPLGSPSPPLAPSMLAGVDAFVDQFFGVEHIGSSSPHYRHKTSCHRAAENSSSLNGDVLVHGMYERIERNWPGGLCRSDKNWRLQPQTSISERNSSKEKTFEKAVATHCPGWVNMIPVASGMLPHKEEGGRRIDLAREVEPGWFELIELKIQSDTPFYAAIEILGYGLLYVPFRRHRHALGYGSQAFPLLDAHRISLRVLAPREFYAPYDLRDTERLVGNGLSSLVDQLGLDHNIDFLFEQFACGFQWPASHPSYACQVLATKHPIHRQFTHADHLRES